MNLKELQSKTFSSQINQCSKLWKLNPVKKTIYRNKDSTLKELFPFLKRKVTVESLYRWIQYSLGTDEYMWVENIMDRDQITIRDNYPRAYRLLNDWEISPKDIKALKGGPLFNTAGEEIVTYPSFANSINKKNVKALAWLLGVIASILTIYTFFTTLS